MGNICLIRYSARCLFSSLKRVCAAVIEMRNYDPWLLMLIAQPELLGILAWEHIHGKHSILGYLRMVKSCSLSMF